MLYLVFRRCPACGGSVVRQYTDDGRRAVICQYCTWGEFDPPLADTDNLHHPTDEKPNQWVWLTILGFLLIALGCVLWLAFGSNAQKPPG